ncbi:GyrI-like domain-containing protein [Microbacterium sp. M28]|uniref:GyrI-like domain-containing protein n=1 Tax=Microbacterium sp. M28 TaxID=2962064 RepID=UPI0021F4DE24|nr:GyrI-like domain-containing protein [Microbacterium sp. M28]UYO95838.1 GyrI-like domain-containing protein [Microbacterium sp. M28]
MTAFPATPFGSADRIELEPHPLAVVRHESIRIDDVRAAFDTGYAAIGRLFADGTLQPAGPALAIYRGNPMEQFDLELGFPVAVTLTGPVEANGTTVSPAVLPAGRALATTTHGSYDHLGSAWSALVESADAAGLSPRGISIEVYVSDPTEAPERLRTDLILPLN